MAHNKRNKAANTSLTSGNGDEKEGNTEVSFVVFLNILHATSARIR